MQIKKIFTILLVLFQLLILYATPIPSLSVADILLIILYPFLILYLIKKQNLTLKINYLPLMIYFFYILFQFLFNCFFHDTSYIDETFFRTCRYLFYLFTVIFIAPQMFDVRLGVKLLKYVSLVSTLFLFFQMFMVKFMRLYIPGTIPGIPLMRSELEDFNQNIMQATYLIRPRSFFSEPAHYASYVIGYLVIGLFFKQKNSSKEYITEVIITIGLIVANSATGIIAAGVIWGIWILRKISINYSKSMKMKFVIPFILLVPITFLMVLNSKYFNIFMERVFGKPGESAGSAFIGRMGNYSSTFSIGDLTWNEILFGRGMIDIVEYIPAIPTIFYYYGIVGMGLSFIIFIIMFYIVKFKHKVVLIMIVMLSIGGDAIFGPNCLFYFLFFMNDSREYAIKDYSEKIL